MDIQDTFVTTPAYLNNLYVREGKDTNIFETGNIMLLDQSNMTRHHVDDYMSENHIVPRQVLEVTTMDLLIEFVKIGLGVACVTTGNTDPQTDHWFCLSSRKPGNVIENIFGIFILKWIGPALTRGW